MACFLQNSGHRRNVKLSLGSIAFPNNTDLTQSFKQKLAWMLSRNGAIEILNLAYNPFGPEGLRRLSSFLGINTILATLGLRGCAAQRQGTMVGIYALCRYGLLSQGYLRVASITFRILHQFRVFYQPISLVQYGVV